MIEQNPSEPEDDYVEGFNDDWSFILDEEFVKNAVANARPMNPEIMEQFLKDLEEMLQKYRRKPTE
jgi:hypothetical protein